MNTLDIRNFKNHIVLYIILILILIALVYNAGAQLEVFDKNPNYLTYNGEPILLICAVPNDNDFHVMDFDINFITTMKSKGVNHIWFMIENFTAVSWTYTKNTPDAFYDKIAAIAKKAYENDVMVGISFFGYGLINYPWNYSFNAACTKHCGYDPGPLQDPMDFYNVTSTDASIMEARQVQQLIMQKVIQKTWRYPNVYYSPGWEIKVIWNTKVAEWFKWAVDFMKEQGKLIDPNIEHLFAIEKTMTPMQAVAVGADFVIDEDGNAYKSDGIPFVYWSMDGVYRNTAVWNDKTVEPTYNWEFMRSEVINGAAGIATIWGVDPVEQLYLQAISNFANSVDNWCDEPGQEILETTVPATHTSSFVNLPGSDDCLDITDYSSFQIANISATSGLTYTVDRSVKPGSVFYTDRTYTLYYIPPDYRGLIWIKTANSDKKNYSSPFLSYTINQDATIYVGYDTRIPAKPSWLSSWTSSGEYIIDDTGVEYEMLSKDFTQGTVNLGSNSATTGSMYIVLHKPIGTADLTPPAAPASLILTPLFN
ncbi:MAG TPA: hypothetical protein PLP19_15540 [bacterium]|nr:hypothetical protein [bacterium]HPN44904.1 hypothetical protein [bacterium]